MNNPIPRIDPEFKSLMPPLSPEEYGQLEQNILAHRKCRDAVVVWGDILVDGYNRLRICATHSIPFEIKQVHFDSREEAMLWILDNQLGRRNLTDAMRIELALSKAELLRQKAKKKQSDAGGDKSVKSRAGALLAISSKPDEEPVNVRMAVAKDAGVSDRTVQTYMQVAKHGSPELLDDVKNGNIKINTAHRLLDKEITKKLKLANEQLRFIEETRPKLHEWEARLPFEPPHPSDDFIIGNEITTQDINERLLGLLEKIKNVKEAYEAQPTD